MSSLSLIHLQNVYNGKKWPRPKLEGGNSIQVFQHSRQRLNYLSHHLLPLTVLTIRNQDLKLGFESVCLSRQRRNVSWHLNCWSKHPLLGWQFFRRLLKAKQGVTSHSWWMNEFSCPEYLMLSSTGNTSVKSGTRIEASLFRELPRWYDARMKTLAEAYTEAQPWMF